MDLRSGSTSSASGGNVAALTGLRFFAAAAIVVGHGGARPYFSGLGITIFDVRQAVSLFFVLSGFVLAYSYPDLGRSDFYRFIGARLARVWPAHLVTACAAAALWAPAPDIVAANVLLVQAWAWPSEWHYSLNGVSWSVSVELALYCTFPLVLRYTRIALAFGAALVASAMVASTDLSAAEGGAHATVWSLLYVWPPSHLLEFASGVAACKLFVRWRQAGFPGSGAALELSAVCSCFALMIGMTWASAYWSAALGPARVWITVSGAFAGFALVLPILSAQRGPISSFLRLTPMVFLGEISFSLYLVHQIILRSITTLFAGAAEAHWVSAYLAYWICSLLCAFLLHRWIEVPMRRLVRHMIGIGHRRPAATASFTPAS